MQGQAGGYVALFGRKGVAGRPEPFVLLSRSNKALRKTLAALWIEFSRPLVASPPPSDDQNSTQVCRQQVAQRAAKVQSLSPGPTPLEDRTTFCKQFASHQVILKLPRKRCAEPSPLRSTLAPRIC